MKKIFFILGLFLAFGASAQPPEGPANKGMTFGVATTENGSVNANDLAGHLNAGPKEVKVKGKVVEVCKAEGCWLRLETATGTIMIRMKDHSFFVPVSMTGKTIVAEGNASVKETPVELLRHYAEDAGKSKAEIEAIKEPKKEIQLQARGILVL